MVFVKKKTECVYKIKKKFNRLKASFFFLLKYDNFLINKLISINEFFCAI